MSEMAFGTVLFCTNFIYAPRKEGIKTWPGFSSYADQAYLI